MTNMLFLLLLGYVQSNKQETKTITIPKAIQVLGLCLFLAWIASLFFSEKIQNENPKGMQVEVYKKVVASLDVDGWDMPSLEELSQMETSELVRTYLRLEKTNNRLLVDVVRDMLLARHIDGEDINFLNLLPDGLYTVTVVDVGGKFAPNIIQTEQFYEEVVKIHGYIGAVDVFIEGGMFRLSGHMYARNFARGELEKVVVDLLEDLGFKNKKPTGKILPEEGINLN